MLLHGAGLKADRGQREGVRAIGTVDAEETLIFANSVAMHHFVQGLRTTCRAEERAKQIVASTATTTSRKGEQEA